METSRAPYSGSVLQAPREGQSEEPFESGFHSYVHVLRNRKGILGICVLISLAFATLTNLTQRPVYQASAELLLEPKDSKGLAPSSANPVSFLNDPTFLLTQQRLIRGPRLAEKVLVKLEKAEHRELLLSTYGVRPSRKRKETSVFSEKEKSGLLAGIQRSLSARQVERGARIISILLSGYSPEGVTLLTNAAAEAYVQINYESHMDSFRQSFRMISKSLGEVREKIKTGEIATQKIDAQIRLLEALKIYGERHPLVIQLRTDIPELTRKLGQGNQAVDTIEVSQRKDLRPLLLQPVTRFEELQRIESDLYTLKPILEQEVSSNREMYNSIFHRLQEVEISGGSSVWVTAEVVEPATVPSKPIRPNKRMNLLMGFFIGLLLGVGLAFFQEYLDSSVRSLEDIRGYLKLFPLGMVPRVELVIKEEGGQGGEKKVLPARAFWLASDSDVPLYVSEAYRIIRTNLAFGSIDTTLKVLQVTSAVKGEGKTTTAANLAISMALTGARTLVVDADLRRPSLHRILHVPERGAGLSDALTNGTSWESVVVPTGTPNLFFMSAGTMPPNPAELLSSKRMSALLQELKEGFDMVIFDSPPVISVADSAILASRVDGTIFVSRSGYIPRHLCVQAKNALESVNGRIVGCVLNGALTEHQPYYYHRYYREYGRYDQDGNKKEGEGIKKLELAPTVERLQALKEPFWVLFSSGLGRLMQLVKRERRNSESKSSVGSL